MKDYVSISLEKKLVEAIDKAVEKDLFVTSRAAYIRRAVEQSLRGA